MNPKLAIILIILALPFAAATAQCAAGNDDCQAYYSACDTGDIGIIDWRGSNTSLAVPATTVRCEGNILVAISSKYGDELMKDCSELDRTASSGSNVITCKYKCGPTTKSDIGKYACITTPFSEACLPECMLNCLNEGYAAANAAECAAQRTMCLEYCGAGVCASTSCPDKCDGRVRMYEGKCVGDLGNCEYQSQECDYGCDKGKCFGKEICDNNVDDDANGLIDCADPSCEEQCHPRLIVYAVYEGESKDQRPIAGAQVNISYPTASGRAKLSARTDSKGAAKFDAAGFQFSSSSTVSATVYLEDSAFKMVDGRGGVLNAWDTQTKTTPAELENVTIQFTGDNRVEARMWERLHQAYEFYGKVLGTSMEYQMPEDIYVTSSGCTACHAWSDTAYPATHDAGITYNADVYKLPFDMKWSPQNWEWHEFNHHAMFAIYSGMWDSKRINNHDGWKNPASDDSYAEAFAEFMSLMETDYYLSEYPRLTPTSVYYYFGNNAPIAENFEKNLNVTHWPEEFAIAGILWDLYDPVPAYAKIDKDHIQLSRGTMFSVLNSTHTFSDGKTRFIQNTRDLYEAFAALPDPQLTKKYVDAYPRFNDGWMDNATALEKVFITHYAYFDTNQNGHWDAGEPVGNTPTEGNWSKMRTDIELSEGSYIKATVNGGAVSEGSVTVSVKYDEPYDYLNYDFESTFSNGLIGIPPQDDTPATLEMSVSAPGYSASAPITVTSAEYNAAYDASKAFFAEKQFTVTKSAAPSPTPTPSVCNNDGTCDASETSACDDCAGGDLLAIIIGFGVLAILAIVAIGIAVVGIAAYLLLRKKKK